MLQSMLAKSKWTLRDWKGTLDDQLNSWMMYMPGTKDSAQAKDMKVFKGILLPLYTHCYYVYLRNR